MTIQDVLNKQGEKYASLSGFNHNSSKENKQLVTVNIAAFNRNKVDSILFSKRLTIVFYDGKTYIGEDRTVSVTDKTYIEYAVVSAANVYFSYLLHNPMPDDVSEFLKITKDKSWFFVAKVS